MTIDQLQDEIDRSGAAAKFPEVGASVAGVIVDGFQSQQTDFVTGEPLTYKDGNPRMQQVIVLDVEGSDENVKLYAKGQMWKAIKDAVKTSGGTIAVGGKLGVRFVREEPSEKGNPQKIYEAQYQAPSSFDAVAQAAAEPQAASTPIF